MAMAISMTIPISDKTPHRRARLFCAGIHLNRLPTGHSHTVSIRRQRDAIDQGRTVITGHTAIERLSGVLGRNGHEDSSEGTGRGAAGFRHC